MVVEGVVLSVFGWGWLAAQEVWFPSLLCSHVCFSFLLITCLNLVMSSLFVDGKQVKMAYFNTVLGYTVFVVSCVVDTFTTSTLGGEQFKPPADTTGCCSNCNIAKANQILFFIDSPLYMVQAGLLCGYLLVHLLLAGAQVLDSGQETRSIWMGTGWGVTLGIMLSARFIVMFDGSAMTLVPDSVIYLLLFSQPLVTLGVVYWLFLQAFMAIMIAEGVPQLNILGIKIVRSVAFGVTVAFVIVSGAVLGLRGMLTLPLACTLLVLVLCSAFGVVEAYMGKIPELAPTTVRRILPPAPPTAMPNQRTSRNYIQVPVQMVAGKKGV